MTQKNLSVWLRVILLGVIVALLFVYLYVIPRLGSELSAYAPEYASAYLPWLIFVSATAIPLAVALAFAWSIFAEIGADRSFTLKNARSLAAVSVAAAVDTAYFFIGNVVFLFLGMSHPFVLVSACFISFAGIAIAVIAGALSHLVVKAAVLQETNDLTV